MKEYLDDVLRKWAISMVCPYSGEPESEYEIRAVKNMMYMGLKLLQAAQGVPLANELDKKSEDAI